MEHYDAILHDWTPDLLAPDLVRLFGRIHDDTKGRFVDGAYVFTSPVNMALVKKGILREGDVVQTRNTSYRLGRMV